MVLARINGRMSVLSLVLVGVIVSTFFGSAISIIKLLADPFAKLPSITYWLMGSIASVGYSNFMLGIDDIARTATETEIPIIWNANLQH